MLRPYNQFTVAASTAYTISPATDELIDCNATTAAFTVTLPALAKTPLGQVFTITKVDSSANAVTVAVTGSDTFLDGTTSKTAATQWSYLRVACSFNGSQAKVWRLV
jgi:hypothetical protein